MSFEVTKLLTLLLYPLSQSFLLGLLGLLFWVVGWRGRAFFTLFLGMGWLYLCSTATVANYLMDTLERDFVSRGMSTIEPADAIVLLGGAMRGDTHMGTLPDLNQHADRLVHAVALYKEGKAPVILLTGGAPAGNRAEAQQMKEVLRVMGVPARDLVLETQSRDTHDNALFSAMLLKKLNKNRILLVTSAFHMRRAAGLFRAQGLEVVPAPTDFQRLAGPSTLPGGIPAVGNLTRTTYAIHEIVGYWVYRWRHWL